MLVSWYSTAALTADVESIGTIQGGISTKIYLAASRGGLPLYYESLAANFPTSKMVVAGKGYVSEKSINFVRNNIG
jgi:hypothetical protein